MVCTQGVQVVKPYDPNCNPKKEDCGAHPPDSTYDLRFDVHDCSSTGGPGLNLNLSYTGPDGLHPLIGNVVGPDGFVEGPYAPGGGRPAVLAETPYAPNDAWPLPIQGLPVGGGEPLDDTDRYKMQTARASCGRCKRIYESCQDATKRAARAEELNVALPQSWTESECWLKEVQPCMYPAQTQPCQADEKQRMRYTGIGQRVPASPPLAPLAPLLPLPPPTPQLPTHTTTHTKGDPPLAW